MSTQGYAEFYRADFRLLGEQPAHVDAGADDAVIARPGAQHFARATAQIENRRIGRQSQRGTERSEFFRSERVVDAVSAFGDGENSWDIHCIDSLNR